MDDEGLIFAIFLVSLLIASVISLWPNYIAGEKVQDYKGDEVWYVDAARNYLYKNNLTVLHVTELPYTPNSSHIATFYGVNVFVRMPESTSENTPVDPNWYDWEKYDKYVYSVISKYKLSNIYAFDWQEINYGRYYYVPEDEFNVFVDAIRNITAPEDIVETIEYKMDNNQTCTTTITVFKKGEKIFNVRPGFRYGDKFGIDKYYNLEHPFLGKSFIMLSMLVFGDRPVAWRIPSLLSFLSIIVLLAFTVKNLTGSYFWGGVAATLAAIDPGLRMLGATAMLDIYVAFFMALVAYYFSKRNLTHASLFTGFATAVKLNGAFVGLGIGLFALSKAWRTSKTTTEAIKTFIKNISKYLLLGAVGFAIGNIPVFLFISPQEWKDGLLASFSWHLSYKGDHPFTSPVWNWFFNKNPFMIYSDPRILIQTNWFMWNLAVIIGFLGIYLVHKKYRTEFALEYLGGSSIIVMYVLMYFLGGKSQYSYYAVQITPFMIVVFVVSIAYILNWGHLRNAFKGTALEKTIESIMPDGAKMQSVRRSWMNRRQNIRTSRQVLPRVFQSSQNRRSSLNKSTHYPTLRRRGKR
ncbi:phospholipid carrier-dependent glycosyltransferase [Thermococcus sp. LS1]|uniref:glycosyltransferase family 39 protein n=1 Tax=Thermococcus sp. LS1 TaxID=1638259 RepID=UPI0014391DCC|nr:glycosyltransferase family 39 protein [Thermococcus sp. LS1]NJE00242.1 phospholipid carrier-dependent glycosyltransferase [Thermococcus sp. LS1]